MSFQLPDGSHATIVRKVHCGDAVRLGIGEPSRVDGALRLTKRFVEATDGGGGNWGYNGELVGDAAQSAALDVRLRVLNDFSPTLLPDNVPCTVEDILTPCPRGALRCWVVRTLSTPGAAANGPERLRADSRHVMADSHNSEGDGRRPSKDFPPFRYHAEESEAKYGPNFVGRELRFSWVCWQPYPGHVSA